ncbi:hypothetical protein GIB67_006569 [Kingdonia uniflora]|uniref:Uncharacterized protein n=1 Tax=Kingdonia uniflora TaxID=39325 RepID=A0A7J7LF39_9MAGN|nr:hypothetical protein GIB67_006569 [Kingdonia uniflora]
MERGQQNTLINLESCYDEKVVLPKRYKASEMESRKDASVLESRMARARGNKCQPHEREKINSSSLSPNNRFTTKDLKNIKSERREIRGTNQEFFEEDKRLKRAKAGRIWNDNIIWVKGNFLQRDDEELLDLRFRSVKQSVKSTVERKESLLDEVIEEETELELVMGKSA